MYSFLLLFTVMLTQLGECPFFPLVPKRHPSCYEDEACTKHSECKRLQKCCENPCGLRKCYDIDVNPLESIEKCPVLAETHNCEVKQAKYCYINNCKRCCTHDKNCNPASFILTEAKQCFPEICSNYTCKYQGEDCFVDQSTHKPYCQCVTSCKSTQNYICASNGKLNQTFLNICFMNKHACASRTNWNILYDGRCKVEKKPVLTVKNPVIESSMQHFQLNSSVSILCYGDHNNVKLKWLQQRKDGSHYELPNTMVGMETTYITNNEKRKILALQIDSLGYGGYGTYLCKQYYNNSWLHDAIQILPTKNMIFKRSSCSQPQDTGFVICNGNFQNYYHDAIDNQCKSMIYKGCGGNANNFQTLTECEMRCKGEVPQNGTYLINIGEKCGKTVCKYFSKCISSECVCSSSCSFLPNPVCGSDGQTYRSKCILELQACRWRKDLIPLYEGKCLEVTKNIGAYNSQATTTTTTQRPKNLCVYKHCPPYSKCIMNPFTRAPQCICPKSCTFSPKILCASDMKQYVNECFMKVISCRKNMKLTILNYGLCKFTGYKLKLNMT